MNRAVAFGLMLGGPLAAFAAVSGDGSGLKLEGVTVNGEKVCEIERRVERDGVAMRYRLPRMRRRGG